MFYRLIHKIAQDFKNNLQFTGSALLALQYASEGFLVDLMSEANLATIHVKRVTIKPKDIELVKDIVKDFCWHVS